LYAAYVSYIIKRIWYGMVFLISRL